MKLRGADHVQPEGLLALAEGGPLSLGARAHLDRCRGCARLLAATTATVEDMRADRLSEPAESTVHRAVALFPARPPLWERVAEVLGQLVRGSEDLRLAAAAGVRGEAASPARLLFAGEDLHIDLELDGDEDGVRVTGQILGRPHEELPVVVWAVQGDRPAGAAAVGDHGVFVFERLPHGSFDLVLDLGQRHLRLPVRPEPV